MEEFNSFEFGFNFQVRRRCNGLAAFHLDSASARFVEHGLNFGFADVMLRPTPISVESLTGEIGIEFQTPAKTEL